jgi:hypothetical protein
MRNRTLGRSLAPPCAWTANAVHHPERVVSIVRWDHDLRRDVLRAVGRFGDRSAARALRRFADDPEIGHDAVEAVRAIEGRWA